MELHRPRDGHPLRTAERRFDAKNILTTEAIVAEVPEEDSGDDGMPDMSGMI